MNKIDPLGFIKISVDKKISQILINKINNIVKQGGGTITVPDLLDVLNFPPDAAQRLKDARGDVKITNCRETDNTSFSNKGKPITERIPGGFGSDIMLDKNIKGDIKLTSEKIILNNLKGIKLDLPGPFNPELDSITVTPGIIDINL